MLRRASDPLNRHIIQKKTTEAVYEDDKKLFEVKLTVARKRISHALNKTDTENAHF
ncbi:hypothetical protein MTO96_037643, partial [Rhipicephalus appendiculatus]